MRINKSRLRAEIKWVTVGDCGLAWPKLWPSCCPAKLLDICDLRHETRCVITGHACGRGRGLASPQWSRTQMDRWVGRGYTHLLKVKKRTIDKKIKEKIKSKHIWPCTKCALRGRCCYCAPFGNRIESHRNLSCQLPLEKRSVSQLFNVRAHCK